MKKIAVVQVKGTIGARSQVKETLKLLRLVKKNSCSIVNDTPNYLGMLELARDYITWGELDKDIFKSLLEKRGRIAGNKALDEKYLKDKASTTFDRFVDDFMNFKKDLKDIPGLKRFFRLLPPRGGYGKVKKQYSMGGALGYRKEDINDLIKRML